LRDLDGRELPGAVPRAELADRRVGDLVAHGCSPPPVANRTAGSTVLLARESRARTGASASLRSLRTIASRFSAIVTPAARMRSRTSSSVSSSDRSMTRLLARSHGAASGPRVTAPGVGRQGEVSSRIADDRGRAARLTSRRSSRSRRRVRARAAGRWPARGGAAGQEAEVASRRGTGEDLEARRAEGLGQAAPAQILGALGIDGGAEERVGDLARGVGRGPEAGALQQFFGPLDQRVELGALRAHRLRRRAPVAKLAATYALDAVDEALEPLRLGAGQLVGGP